MCHSSQYSFDIFESVNLGENRLSGGHMFHVLTKRRSTFSRSLTWREGRSGRHDGAALDPVRVQIRDRLVDAIKLECLSVDLYLAPRA